MIKGEQKRRNFTLLPPHLTSFLGHPKLSEATLQFQETYVCCCHVLEYFFVVGRTDITFIRWISKYSLSWVHNYISQIPE